MGPVRVQEASNDHLWNALSQLVWVHQDEPLPRIFAQPHQKICHSDPDLPLLPKREQYCALWPEAREHSSKKDKQVWYQNYRLWIWLFWKWEDLHLYPIKVLQSTRNRPWNSLSGSNRHVELWMYPLRTLRRLPPLSRRRRKGSHGTHDGGQRYPTKISACKVEQEKGFLWRRLQPNHNTKLKRQNKNARK